MDIIKKILDNRYVAGAICALMALVVIIPIIGSILKSGVDCDSAYYLCMAERILDGYIPYIDLSLGYTPLWLYIEAGYKLLFHIPNGIYWPYLILFYAFQIAGAYFLYRLARSMDIKKSVALFAGWLYLLMSHWMQGNAVLLEIPCMTFCILACWLVIEYKDKKWYHYLWLGALAACSFLVKQYGLGTFALCLYLMLFISKCNWKQFVAFVVGYMLPVLICVMLFGDAFIRHVLLNGYGTQSAEIAGYDTSFIYKMQSMRGVLNYFCYLACPVVYIGWLFAPLAYRQRRVPQLVFAYCGILGYSLVFYFSGGGLHYFQNLLPFAVLLVAELLHITKDTKWKYVMYVMVAWVVLVSGYKTYHNRVYKQYIKGTQRIEQQALACEVRRYVKEERLFVVHGGLYHLYFTADVMPPNLKTIGYSFGPLGLNERTAGEQIHSADWVIRFSLDYDFESFFTDSLKNELEQYPAVCLNDSAVLLHKMH